MNKRRRERREYLLQKELELKDRRTDKKKREIEDALESNKKIPHDLKADAMSLLNEMIYEGQVDEECKLPKIMVTTSRDPSSQLLKFSKHFALILNARHVVRGKMREEEIGDMAHKCGYTCVFVIYENKGRPVTLIVSYFPYGPTMMFTVISNTIFKPGSTLGQKVYFVCENMDGDVGIKVKTKLALLFPRCDGAKRVVGLVNRSDCIAFRHYLMQRDCGRLVLKKSLGMDLKVYEIRKGTFEMDGEAEWVYKPYMNSRKTKEDIGITKDVF